MNIGKAIKVKRGYCICCGVQRDENGTMTHDFECIWYEAVDIDYIKDGERTKIFCPYTPKELK
jgi:hypothetical protein